MKRIPITTGTPAQEFSITLNGTSYNMTAKWNSRASFWTLDIADENKIAIVNGVTLKTGSDLLSPYNFGIGGLYVYNASDTEQEATLETIGVDAVLVYLTPEENDAAKL